MELEFLAKMMANKPRVDALIEALEAEGLWPIDSAESPPRRPRKTPKKVSLSPRRRQVSPSCTHHDARHLQEQLNIVVAYCNGSTRFGLHVQTVRARLRDAGVRTNETRSALSPEEKHEIQQLHHTGQSARQLARRYGVAHTTILRTLTEN